MDKADPDKSTDAMDRQHAVPPQNTGDLVAVERGCDRLDESFEMFIDSGHVEEWLVDEGRKSACRVA
jgi:hypothetical protein